MKIEIDYFINKQGGEELPCGASTIYSGELICGVGKTWEEAEEKMIAYVKRFIETKVPPRKRVEVDVSEEEEEILPAPVGWEHITFADALDTGKEEESK